MKIIEPKVELWRQEDAKAHVARCARVCYGKETGNDEATVKRLINSKHWSMFRHETVYAMVPALAWQSAFGMAINKYIRTLVSDCLVCDLETKFDNQYTIIYMKRPNFENKRKDYIISVPCDITDESEEYIQSLLTYDNYKDLEYVRKGNEFYFYLKTYSNE